MNKYYTYAYLREDGTPYYIGKGRGQRAYWRNSNDRIPAPQKNRILILKSNLTEESAFRHEIYMISLFGRKDLGTGILINLTDGGEGRSNMSQECREKIRKINLNKEVSDITRKRMSDVRKGKKQSKEWIEKRTEKLRGKIRTEEQIEKLSQSHIGQVAWNKGIPHKEESKQKMSNSKKGMMWWNNGSICKMSNESPGPEWNRGRIYVRKAK
jgi:hypothetical protein